jgi:uncharacterized protein (TIGR02444 family)
MPTPPEDPADSLWRFAVAMYGRPGIGDLCLDLQDRHGIDVPLLLWAAWCGAARGLPLDAAALDRVDAAVGGWRRDVVRPLRAVRRRLRHGPAPLAPTVESAALRDRVKALELEAERLQLRALALHPADPPSAGTAAAVAMTPSAALDANLRLMLPAGFEGEVTQRLHAAALSGLSTVVASSG